MRRILLFPYLEVFLVSERFRLSMLLISVLKSVLLQPLLAAITAGLNQQQSFARKEQEGGDLAEGEQKRSGRLTPSIFREGFCFSQRARASCSSPQSPVIVFTLFATSASSVFAHMHSEKSNLITFSLPPIFGTGNSAFIAVK